MGFDGPRKVEDFSLRVSFVPSTWLGFCCAVSKPLVKMPKLEATCVYDLSVSPILFHYLLNDMSANKRVERWNDERRRLNGRK